MIMNADLLRGEKVEVYLQIGSRGGEIGIDGELGEVLRGGLEGCWSHCVRDAKGNWNSLNYVTQIETELYF